MRSLVGVLIGAALLFVVYYFYLKKMPTTDEGTAPTQAISLTGVRSDLLQIAMAERGYIATNGHCASLDELISSHSLSMTRTERDGYSYALECSGGEFSAAARHLPAPALECSGGEFSAAARHLPAPAGSPIRYPNLAIDSAMQVHEIE